MAFKQKLRSYGAAHFALELDGKRDIGLFKSIEGGGVKADVMTYQNGANYDRWRSLGKQKYEDIKLQVGMAMSAPFYQWIEQFFTGKGERKNGAIVAADFYYNERARREFSDALIKEITFPKLDGGDKAAVSMTVTLAVEDIVFKAGNNQKLAQSGGTEAQKEWSANNFRLRLDGLAESAFTDVSKVDSFTIKQNIIEHHTGGRTSPIKTASQIDFPNLVFYVPESSAETLWDRFTKRAMITQREIAGSTGQRGGQLEVLDQEKKTVFTVEFLNIELISITPEKSDAGSEEIKLVKVEAFTEGMKFSYKA